MCYFFEHEYKMNTAGEIIDTAPHFTFSEPNVNIEIESIPTPKMRSLYSEIIKEMFRLGSKAKPVLEDSDTLLDMCVVDTEEELERVLSELRSIV